MIADDIRVCQTFGPDGYVFETNEEMCNRVILEQSAKRGIAPPDWLNLDPDLTSVLADYGLSPEDFSAADLADMTPEPEPQDDKGSASEGWTAPDWLVRGDMTLGGKYSDTAFTVRVADLQDEIMMEQYNTRLRAAQVGRIARLQARNR